MQRLVLLKSFAIFLITCIYVTAIYALLHPKVSKEYRDYFIDHSTTDWYAGRNHASPEEGIRFDSAEIPEFVASTYGFARREAWGRWTDTGTGTEAGILFRRNFEGQVCVQVEAYPSLAERGKPIEVVFGDSQAKLVMNDQHLESYSLDFDLQKPSNKLLFSFGGQVPRHSEIGGGEDTRRLGIAFIWLGIHSKRCETVKER